MSFKTLCEIYGFKPSTVTSYATDELADKELWNLIGHHEFIPGRTKASMIKNPAIRYVHKLLTSTLLWRVEGDRVASDDMVLLARGLRPFHKEAFSSRKIPSRDINLGVLFARKLMALKPWVLKERKGVPKLQIGGVLTPIFLHSGHSLGRPCKAPQARLDQRSLYKGHFLGEAVGNSFIYRFTFKGEIESKVLLPNQDITSVRVFSNLAFCLSDDVLLEEGCFHVRNESRGKGIETEHEVANEDEEENQVFGSARYYQKPFKGKANSAPLQHALDGVELNQRWLKWNQRNFNKLNKKYKALKKMVVDLVAKSAPCSGTSVLEGTQGGAQSSSQGAKRKRRNQPPPPSPPQSDNPSLDCSTSDHSN